MSRTSSFYRWFATAAAAGVVLLLVAACTTSFPVRSPSNSASPSHATSGSSTPPSHPTVRLSCADAGSGNAPTGNSNLVIGGVTLEGLAGNVVGAHPADIGLTVPTEHPLYFVKAPAWLKAGAPITTIELSSASGGYLAWVPARIWAAGGSSGVDLTPWMASTLVFDGCPDRDTTYFGGLLSTNANICLTLQISDRSGTSEQIPVGSATHC